MNFLLKTANSLIYSLIAHTSTLQVADFLVKAGADLELGCSTPLMEASQEGHLELVQYLIKVCQRMQTILRCYYCYEKDV